LIACVGLGALDLLALNLRIMPAWLAERTAHDMARAGELRAAAAPVQVAAQTSVHMGPLLVSSAMPTLLVEAREPGEIVALAPPDPFVLQFREGSARVTTRARGELDQVLQELQAVPEVRVVGHASARGPAIINERLSEQRALSVARRLESLGVPHARIHVEWRGARDAHGTDRDRRVEIYLEGTP